MFVNDEAESPAIDRWRSEGSCRIVPIKKRNVNGFVARPVFWFIARVVSLECSELNSKKRSVGSLAA
jgi:hypothetical protein